MMLVMMITTGSMHMVVVVHYLKVRINILGSEFAQDVEISLATLGC